MQAIMLMFDSLNRHMLPPYGCDWVHAPNFQRLAENSVVFDSCYAGSLPCMPARRELHTGRYNFLHRSWGPIEPFDDSLPEILKKNGVYTHLISDHYHYWEDGGCTYHTRYNTWEISRGQEGDPWKGEVKDPFIDELAIGRKNESWRQDWVNRQYLDAEDKQPQAKTFKMALDFINKNQSEDKWFLHVECFDPHEPFFTQQKYKDLYQHQYNGPHFDWPPYRMVEETSEQVEHVRKEYAALLSMCDEYLGKLLDVMDEHQMWDDTMLIINTDHGFLLGEHGWWAKNVPPLYNEIAHTPLFIWDPRCKIKGSRCGSLVQTIDLVPTIYDFFEVKAPQDVQGKCIKDAFVTGKQIREAALFGLHGGHLNCTDGKYVYMKAPVNSDDERLYNYTLMPTHLSKFFGIDELKTTELAGPFSFTKGCKVMKIKSKGPIHETIQHKTGDFLYDLQNDPDQLNPIEDEMVVQRMQKLLVKLMKETDAPLEMYERYGLKVCQDLD